MTSTGVSVKVILSTSGGWHSSLLILCFWCFVVVFFLLSPSSTASSELTLFSFPEKSSHFSSYDESDSDDDPFVNERAGKVLSSTSEEIFLSSDLFPVVTGKITLFFSSMKIYNRYFYEPDLEKQIIGHKISWKNCTWATNLIFNEKAIYKKLKATKH